VESGEVIQNWNHGIYGFLEIIQKLKIHGTHKLIIQGFEKPKSYS